MSVSLEIADLFFKGWAVPSLQRKYGLCRRDEIFAKIRAAMALVSQGKKIAPLAVLAGEISESVREDWLKLIKEYKDGTDRSARTD